MKHKTFFWFFLPTGLAMLLFIAFPIASVVTQSVHAPHDALLISVETCDPFGCKQELAQDSQATSLLRDAEPLGQWVGLQVYLDRNHLAVDEVADAWRSADGMAEFAEKLNNLPFYRAMGFTLTYTFTVTPLLIILGF